MRPEAFRPQRTYGISLTEVLVAGSILLILSAAFAAIFAQARSGTEGGGERIQIRSVQREAQRRLTLLLRGAMAPNEVDPAIVVPEDGETKPEVRFHAPSDLLDFTEPFDPRTPKYPEYLIDRSASEGGLVVRRTDGVGVLQRIGRDFRSVEFTRNEKFSLRVTIVSESRVRGSGGSVKIIQEVSENLIMLVGVR